MILFYLLLLVITAVPVAMVLPSLLRKNPRKPGGAEWVDQEIANRMNIEITRSRINEVQRHLENARDRTVAEQELQATMLDDLQNQDSPAKRTTSVPAVWNVALLLMIPVASLIIYNGIGNPKFADTRNPLVAENPNPAATPDLPSLLDQLEEKIAEDPDNPQGWELAATTYMRIGNYAKAENAYAELNRIIVGNPDLLTAWADASILNNGSYTPDAREQIEKALSIDPFHANALWIAGLGARNLGNHAEATGYFVRLKPLLGDDQESIDRVDELIKRSAAIRASENQASPATEASADEPGRGITVVLDIEPDIRQRIDDEAVVFVIAQAKSGPRAPLAVSRHTVADLPLQTTLTESMAMIPDLTIAAFDEITVTARVSLSGNARQQKGDFVSEPATIAEEDPDQSVKLMIKKEIVE